MKEKMFYKNVVKEKLLQKNSERNAFIKGKSFCKKLMKDKALEAFYKKLLKEMILKLLMEKASEAKS